MKILIACEESQVVCKAFREKGHEAYSCDIIDCSGGHPEWHIKDDVLKHLDDGWDMMIAHPPCTYLSYTGNHVWNEEGRLIKRLDALNFFAQLWLAPINKICIENPMGCASPTIAKYSQIIHPYYFGDMESKRTCLWLKNLPLLSHIKGNNLFEKNTHVNPNIYGYYKNGKPIYWIDIISSKDRAGIRSKTFPGIAKAMAEQWNF